MKNIIFSSLFAMSYIVCHSQNSLSGTIEDTNNHSTLEQVNVYFPRLEKGTITNADGTFTINNLPLGNYKLVVSLLGFKTYSTSVNIALGKNTIPIELTPSAIEMEEVIVSTPFHKLQSENVMKVEHAKVSEFKARGAITLADGITSMPGVESISTGVGIGKPIIRGLSANRVLVYTQGIRMENQQFGDEHGLGIGGAGIESVEVIKGPASLLYGSDAMGGVLYLNPEKFASSKDTEGDVNLDYFSNTDGLAVNGGIRTSTEKFKYLLRGSLASHADYQTGNDQGVTNSRFKEYDLKAGMGYQTNRFKTGLRYNYHYSQLGIPEEIGQQTSERSPEFPYQEIATHILSSKSSLFFENSSLEGTLGYIANNRKEFEDGADPALEMNLNTISYNLQYHMPEWKNLETIIGLQGMHQTNKNSGEEILIPDATTNDFGILGTAHLHLDKGGDLQFGLRYDHRAIKTDENSTPLTNGPMPFIDRSFASFNTALGYKIDISKNSVVRLNLASGFRAPNLAELTSDGVHEGTNRYEIGNTDLDNEQNFQIDIALEYKNEHIEIFINGFYNTIDRLIYIEPNGDFVEEDPVFLYRQQNASLYGGELGFHLHPHPLDWLHIESSFETVTGKLSNGNHLPLIPANTLTNTLRVEFDKNKDWLKTAYAFLSLRSVFSQSNVGDFENTSKGYNLLNMGIGGEIALFKQQMNIRLSCNNILNKAYVSHLSRLKVDDIANIGRNINIGLSIPL
ncbi:MAG: TonB-dependent receptor [Flavobacteriaceae bacterium]